MRKKSTIQSYEKDNSLLMQYMEKIIEGDYSAVDVEAFGNKEVPEVLNRLILSVMKNNNKVVMRLNDSMTRIGDSSNVKAMIEQVNSQTTSIESMKGASQDIKESISHIMVEVETIQKGSHEAIEISKDSVDKMNQSIDIVDKSSLQIRQINEQVAEFQEKTIKINEIIDMVKKIANKSGLLALNASIEAARAGEAGKGFAVVANQIKELSANTAASAEDVVRYVGEIRTGIDELVISIDATTKQLEIGNDSVHQSVDEINIMNKQIQSISDAIDTIYVEIDTQSAVTQNFVASIDSIADSYQTLSEECVDTGKHFYRIGRDIDKARSDMARNNSLLTTLDWLTVFEMDHLIFTWRVYNNLADFEHLKIEQLNNPKGCKLGKWMGEQRDSRIAGSTEFRQLLRDHEEVHKHACDSWHAKENGNREKALQHFNLAYDAYNRFVKSIHGLRSVIQTTGDTEETDITALGK